MANMYNDSNDPTTWDSQPFSTDWEFSGEGMATRVIPRSPSPSSSPDRLSGIYPLSPSEVSVSSYEDISDAEDVTLRAERIPLSEMQDYFELVDANTAILRNIVEPDSIPNDVENQDPSEVTETDAAPVVPKKRSLHRFSRRFLARLWSRWNVKRYLHPGAVGCEGIMYQNNKAFNWRIGSIYLDCGRRQPYLQFMQGPEVIGEFAIVDRVVDGRWTEAALSSRTSYFLSRPLQHKTVKEMRSICF